MLGYEKTFWEKGYKLIAGVDEVGRGCLAGAVVAAAVVFPEGLVIEGVADSKKLTPLKRDRLYKEIYSKSLSIGIGVVDEKIIDDINIKEAAKLAMKRAVISMPVYPDFLMVDAEEIDLQLPQVKIIKGDNLSHSIAAASIVAKVFRDRRCAEWDRLYPGYNLKKNKGYCTQEHKEALFSLGPCPIHRRTFIKGFDLEGAQQVLF